MPTYRFADIAVTITDDRAVVRAGKLRFATAAHADGTPPQVAASVLDDMLAAVTDPEAFVLGRMGGATGREALRRARDARKVVYAARKFSYDALADAVDAARERGLL